MLSGSTVYANTVSLNVKRKVKKVTSWQRLQRSLQVFTKRSQINKNLQENDEQCLFKTDFESA